uniref:Uncharacterized protein n=1 Tax=Glossina palpalis gambiensis TaxID=67801 RepID=A0A1B0BM28_9MUSC
MYSYGLWTDINSYRLRMFMLYLEMFIMSKDEIRSSERPASQANGEQPREEKQSSIITVLRYTHQQLSYANGLHMA